MTEPTRVDVTTAAGRLAVLVCPPPAAPERAGHFLHQERPGLVGDIIAEFLGAPI